MARGRKTKRRKVDPETTQRRAFKIKFKPLFDEFYELKSVTLIDAFLEYYKEPVAQNESDHPVLFLHIKEKFKKVMYDNIEQVIEDLRHITRGITTGPRLIDARYIDLYIERTIEPILQAEDILKLYHSKTFNGKKVRLKLDLDNSLIPGQGRKSYRDFEDEERLKMVLSWPLPEITEGINSGKIATAHFPEPKFTAAQTCETTSVTLGGSQDEHLNLNAKTGRFPRKWTDHTFDVDRTVYNAGVTLLSEAFKFNIYIKGDNNINRSNFVATYVDRYLKTDPLKKVVMWGSIPPQTCPESVHGRRDLEEFLERSLFDGLKYLVEESLDKYMQEFLEEFKVINKRMPYFEMLPFKVGEKEVIELKATHRHGRLSNGRNCFGLSFGQNLQVYYCATFKLGDDIRFIPVVYTAVGEFKYVTFDLVQCIKDLEGPEKWNKEFNTADENRRRSRIKELEDTLYKHTTACVHLGCPRYVLTDYYGFLFVKLKFQEDMPRADYGTSLGEVGEYIKAQYSYFTHDDPYIRLYLLSFLVMNQELKDEMAEFKRLIRESFEKENEFIRKQQAQSIAKEAASSVELEVEEPSVGADSNLKFNGALIFNKTLFKRPSYVELGDVITDVIEYGASRAQVIKVDSLKFSKMILEENMVVKEDLPETCVLRVFDPYVGELRAWDPNEMENVQVPYSYKHAIKYIVKETKAYCKLSRYFGDFIPRMFAYGRLSDLYPGVGEMYCRLSGGYIMMEELKPDPEFVVTKEFFMTKILRLYQAIHELDVVHCQLGYETSIITTDGKFFIVDFSRCKFTDSEAEKKAEIDRVYKNFGNSKWS